MEASRNRKSSREALVTAVAVDLVAQSTSFEVARLLLALTTAVAHQVYMYVDHTEVRCRRHCTQFVRVCWCHVKVDSTVADACRQQQTWSTRSTQRCDILYTRELSVAARLSSRITHRPQQQQQPPN